MNYLVYWWGWEVGQCWISLFVGILRPGSRKKGDCSLLAGVSLVQCADFHLTLPFTNCIVFLSPIFLIQIPKELWSSAGESQGVSLLPVNSFNTSSFSDVYLSTFVICGVCHTWVFLGVLYIFCLPLWIYFPSLSALLGTLGHWPSGLHQGASFHWFTSTVMILCWVILELDTKGKISNIDPVFI